MSNASCPVVVGVDGSPTSRAAACWAVAEARDRGVPMRLVAVIDEDRRSRWSAQEALRLACGDVEDLSATVHFETVVRRGSVPEILLQESQSAALICVGTHQRTGEPLGRIATALAEGAHCGVAIISSCDAETDGGVIAVVLDDEPDNHAVVHQAMREGRLRHSTVRQVDRRVDSWARRFPDVHVETVAAGLGWSAGESRDHRLPNLAVLGRKDAAHVAGVVTPNCHPIVGYPDCSLLFVRGDD
jgi:nucleotide-binding universal stress UspA family protein